MNKPSGFKPYYFKTLTSTNDEAKRLARKGLDKILVISDKQTKGRGRFNREWVSGLGGLYMTIVLKEKNLDKARYLTLIATVSVVKTIKKLTKLNALVKWPNDVMVNDKKICGILTETISGKENYALVGIGINVNQQTFNKNISNKAVSLKIITHKNYSLNKLIKLIITNFNLLYNHYNNKNYEKIIDVWKKYSHTWGKRIKAKTISGVYIGEAVDVDNDCNLILKLNNGKLKKIVEGDIFTV